MKWKMHYNLEPVKETRQYPDNTNTSAIPPSLTDDPDDIDIYAANTSTIPCDKCNQQIPADQYETHQLQHSDDNTFNTSTSNLNPNVMIECKYSNCSQKRIPKHKYQDDLTPHQLQSQQVPNTANDELIAYNHQTQLIKQHVAQQDNDDDIEKDVDKHCDTISKHLNEFLNQTRTKSNRPTQILRKQTSTITLNIIYNAYTITFFAAQQQQTIRSDKHTIVIFRRWQSILFGDLSRHVI